MANSSEVLKDIDSSQATSNQLIPSANNRVNHSLVTADSRGELQEGSNQSAKIGAKLNPIDRISDIPYDLGELLCDEKFPVPNNGTKFVVSVCESTQRTFVLHDSLTIPKLAPVRGQLLTEYPNFSQVSLHVDADLIPILKGKWDKKATLKDSSSKLEEKFKDYIAELYNLSGRSDVHFELRFPPTQSRIRIRIDGALQHFRDIEANEMKEMLSIAYNVIGADKDAGCTIEGNELSFENGQNAKLVFGHRGKQYSLRVVTMPITVHKGLDFIVRFLDDDSAATDERIADLDYSPKQLEQMLAAIKKPNGIIFLTGVTGSGKSRSLCALVNDLNAITKGLQKTYTIENPVERIMNNVSQINLEVNGDDGPARFKKLIESTQSNLMRADPDNIGSGEIRDAQTAEFSMSASATGHKCFTTCHTLDAHGVVPRLESFGVERNKIAADGMITLVVAQSLVPTVCKHCHFTLDTLPHNDREAIDAIEDLCELGFENQLHMLKVANPSGCEHCHGGVKGRTTAAETLTPTATIYDKWRLNDDLGAKREWLSKGGFTRLEHAISKVLQGKICPKSVKSVGSMLESKSLREELGVELFTGSV